MRVFCIQFINYNLFKVIQLIFMDVICRKRVEIWKFIGVADNFIGKFCLYEEMLSIAILGS